MSKRSSIVGKNQNGDRKDVRGVDIIHKGKKPKHKITFVDEIKKQPVAEVYVVESYKKYNRDESEQKCCSIL